MQQHMHANISVQILREGEQFVAHSPAFDLATQGSSLEQVKRRFSEAVEIFLEECIERGTLRDVLLDLGWRERTTDHQTSWEPPVLIEHATQQVSLPVA